MKEYAKILFRDAKIVGLKNKRKGTEESPTSLWVCTIFTGEVRYEVVDFDKNSVLSRLHNNIQYIFECEVIPSHRKGSVYFLLHRVFYSNQGSRKQVKNKIEKEDL